MNHRKIRTLIPRLALLFVACVVLAGTQSTKRVYADENVLWIALVGPMSGPDADVGREIVQSVQLALDEVNRNGGVDGRQVRLRTFDDQNDPALARQRAQEIADADEALVVIGHNTSDASAAGGFVYQQHRIPAISGSATADAVTTDNEWYFRTIFDNSTQANFIANYLYRILEEDRASVIFTDSQYGRTLANSFTTNFADTGGTIGGSWRIDADEADRQGVINTILDELENTDEALGTLFLAMSAGDTRDFILTMRERNMHYPLFSSDSIGSSSFARQFAESSPTRIRQEIYAAVPLLFDSANARAQTLCERYLAKYGQEPGWRAATFYDATLVAVDAMRRAELSNTAEERAADRAKIREALAAMNTVTEAFEGATGPIYFDAAGNSQIPVAIGLFENGMLISAPVQLQSVVDPERTGLQKDIAEGQVFRINRQLVDRAQIVYTGVEFVKISDIDQVDSTYTMDFYLWFRYPSSVDAADIEFVNAADTVRMGRPIQEVTRGNLRYQVYRVSGSFKGQFRFYDYPFDSQTLTLSFRHADLTRDQIIYAVDVLGMMDDDPEGTLTRLEDTGVFNTVSNWKPVAARFSQNITSSTSSLGNPNYLGGGRSIEFSRFNAEVQIQRKLLNFIAKNLLPVLLIVIAMYLALYIAPDQINPRMTIGVNGLLTNAFFLVTLSNNLPEIGYTVVIEYVFYFVFLLAILVIVLSLLSYNAQKDHNEQRVQRLMWTGRVLYPVLIMAFAVLFSIYHDLLYIPWV